MNKTQDYVRELVTIICIRRHTIGIVALLVILAAVLIALFWPPVYACTGAILVKRTNPMVNVESVEYSEGEMRHIREEDINSEMQILTARSVAQATVEELTGEAGLDKAADPVAKIERNLRTRRPPNSNVIEVTFTWDDTEEAERILDTYFEQYLHYRAQVYNPWQAREFFAGQIETYKKELQNREDRLVELARGANVLDPQAQINSNMGLQEHLEEEATRLASRRNDLKEHIENLGAALSSGKVTVVSPGGGTGTFGPFGPDPAPEIESNINIRSDLEAELVRLKNRRTELKEHILHLEESLAAGETSVPLPELKTSAVAGSWHQEAIRSNMMVRSALETELTRLKNRKTDLAERILHLDKSLQDRNLRYFSEVDDMQINDLAEALQEAVAEKQRIATVYTEQSAKVQAAKEAVEESFHALREEVRDYVEGRRAELLATKKNIQEVQSKLNRLEQSTIDLDESLGEVRKSEIRAYIGSRQAQLQAAEQNMAAVEARLRELDQQSQQLAENMADTEKAELQSYIEDRRAALQATEENLQTIQTKLETLRKRNVQLYEDLMTTTRLKRQIGLLEESYRTFAKRFEEATMHAKSTTARLFNVTILSSPKAAETPVFPNKLRVISLGIVIGLIVGISSGFLLEFFDHTFKRPEDVENYTGLRHIYSIPEL